MFNLFKRIYRRKTESKMRQFRANYILEMIKAGEKHIGTDGPRLSFDIKDACSIEMFIKEGPNIVFNDLFQ